MVEGPGGRRATAPEGPRGLGRRAALLVRLGRPQFLVYSAVLVSLGGALALHMRQPLSIAALVQTLVLVWTNHLMTHYVNEYFDLEADRAHPSPTGWTGGSRVLAEGLLTPRTAMVMALALTTISVVQALLLPEHARVIAALGLLLGWAYTAPPLRLNYRGLGELTVATVLLGLVPAISVQLQGVSSLASYPWAFLVPAFVVQTVRMLVMNMADYDGDVRVGKLTSVVRLGRARARVVHASGQLVALAWVGLAYATHRLPGALALALLVPAPLALWQTRRVLRGETDHARTADSVVFWATTHSALMMIATLVGIVAGLDVPEDAWPLLLAPAGVAVMVGARTWRRLRAPRVVWAT